jgi:hypothetical protein
MQLFRYRTVVIVTFVLIVAAFVLTRQFTLKHETEMGC